MTTAEVARLKGELYPEETWKDGGVRARVNDADLSLTERDAIVRELGGIICDCSPERNGHLSVPIAPAGKCENCGAEGPFHAEALAYWAGKNASPIASKYQRIDWETAFKEEPEDICWLIEDFLEAGTLNCLFSKPGVGKSLLAMEVALEVLRRGGAVTYVDDENRRADVIDRLRSFGARAAELGSFFYYSFQNLPPLDTETGGEHLDALAAQDQPDLVVLDTISRMVQGTENDADTYIQAYRCSFTKLKKRGIAILRLDHVGKDSAKGQRGSSAKESDADVLFHLHRDGDTVFTLECEKSRSGHVPYGQIITLSRQYDPLRHVWDVRVDIPLSRYEAVMRQMDLLGISPSYGRDKVRKIFRDNGVVGVRNDQLNAAIIERRNRIRRLSPPSGTGGDGGTDG